MMGDNYKEGNETMMNSMIDNSVNEMLQDDGDENIEVNINALGDDEMLR